MEERLDRELEKELAGKIAVTWTTYKHTKFVRLTDMRMKLVKVTDHGLSERSCVGTLRKDGTQPFIRWTTDNNVWISKNPKFWGKLLLGRKEFYPRHEYGDLVKCLGVYPWSKLTVDTVSTLLTSRRDVSELEEPEWFRCSVEFKNIRPRENDSLVDDALNVCPEYTPKEQWYASDKFPGDPENFEDLPTERIKQLREDAHTEYLEDLNDRWDNLDPEAVSIKEEYGYRVPFRLARCGGIVLTPLEELERLENRWQVLNIDTFRKICKSKSWTLYV